MLPVIEGGAALGALGGMLKRGPKISLSAQGQQALALQGDALNAYRNLVQAGPGASDVTASLNATRGFADTLNNISSRSEGLYDMTRGNQLAEQAFGAQRLALNQSFQDQMMQANRAASAAGRSSNDPILRARMMQEQTRQQAMLQAQQSAAAVDFGRQATTDMLALQGQRVDALSGLANQAYGNQQNLFGMSSQLAQQEWSRALGTAQYEQSRGGGLSGAITGMIGGAAAGMQMAQGLQGLMAASAPVQDMAGGTTDYSRAYLSQTSPAAGAGAVAKAAAPVAARSIFDQYGPGVQPAPQRGVQVYSSPVGPQPASNPAYLPPNATSPWTGTGGIWSTLFNSSGSAAYNNGFSWANIGR